MEYELTPIKPLTITRKGGKDSKMSNKTNTLEVKPVKKYAKTRGEHYKDIVIAILVTAIVAFCLGVKVQSDRNAEVAKAVSQAVAPSAQAQPEVKK